MSRFTTNPNRRGVMARYAAANRDSFYLSGRWLVCRTCGGTTNDPARHLNGNGCRYHQARSQVSAALAAALDAGLARAGGHHLLLSAAGVEVRAVASTVRSGAVDPTCTLWAPRWAVRVADLAGPVEWRYFLLKVLREDVGERLRFELLVRLGASPQNVARLLIRRRRSSFDRGLEAEPDHPFTKETGK